MRNEKLLITQNFVEGCCLGKDVVCQGMCHPEGRRISVLLFEILVMMIMSSENRDSSSYLLRMTEILPSSEGQRSFLRQDDTWIRRMAQEFIRMAQGFVRMTQGLNKAPQDDT